MTPFSSTKILFAENTKCITHEENNIYAKGHAAFRLTMLKS